MIGEPADNGGIGSSNRTDKPAPSFIDVNVEKIRSNSLEIEKLKKELEALKIECEIGRVARKALTDALGWIVDTTDNPNIRSMNIPHPITTAVELARKVLERERR